MPGSDTSHLAFPSMALQGLAVLAVLLLPGCQTIPPIVPGAQLSPEAPLGGALGEVVAPPSSSQTAEIAPTPAPAASALATQPLPTPESLLQHRDTPPAGVADQMSVPLAGGPGQCSADWASGPKPEVAWLGDNQVQIGWNDYLCFTGFAPDQEIWIAVTRPDGVVEERHVAVRGDGSASWQLYFLPGDPLGEYIITGTQGENRAVAALTVQPATRPQLVIPVKGVPVGAPLMIGLAGFPPGQAVSLHFYREVDGYLRYTTSVPLVTDQRGEALYAVDTRPGNPIGTYRVLMMVNEAPTWGDFTVSPALRPLGQEDANEAESVLLRQDTPPEGIRALSSSHAPSPFSSKPAAWLGGSLSRGVLTIGGWLTLGFTGFAPLEDLDFEIKASDGQTWTGRLRTGEDGTAKAVWLATPGKPLGEYAVQGVQGIRRATTTFTVQAPRFPRIQAFPFTGYAGSAFSIMLAGFAPHQAVSVHLYREWTAEDGRADHFAYLTSIHLQTDERGEALYTLKTREGDPAGEYSLQYNREDDQWPDVAHSFTLLATPIVVTPESGPASATFRVQFAGFAPHEVVPLQLYRQTASGQSDHLAQVPIEMFVDGSGTYSLYTLPDDPPGTYVVTAGDPEAGARFSVIAPR